MIIDIRNVSWRRNGSTILDDITWTVQPGEHWAIIGLNGSGKTSLLNMISGYSYPSRGEVVVLGNKFGESNLRELRKSIGWVSSSLQENLHTDDMALDIVLSGKFASIGLYDRVAQKDVDRATGLLEQFGCGGFRGRRYSTLSQGEKQKILLARGLMNYPRLLILDEPCTGLDIFARENFLSSICEIASNACSPTLLYVSHHIGEILPVFEHTLLLRNGKVHSAGMTDEVLTQLNLNDFFQRPVEFSWKDDRPWIRVKT